MAVQGKPTRLSESETEKRLRDVPGWRRDGDALTRTWKFGHFNEAKAFVDEVARIANELDHHPDVHLENFSEVRLVTTTHQAGGLSRRDFELARRIGERGPR